MPPAVEVVVQEDQEAAGRLVVNAPDRCLLQAVPSSNARGPTLKVVVVPVEEEGGRLETVKKERGARVRKRSRSPKWSTGDTPANVSRSHPSCRSSQLGLLDLRQKLMRASVCRIHSQHRSVLVASLRHASGQSRGRRGRSRCYDQRCAGRKRYHHERLGVLAASSHPHRRW